MVKKQGVGFKHFENSDSDGLMEDLQNWVNGETSDVSWIAKFHVCLKANTWHAFVKYVKESVE